VLRLMEQFPDYHFTQSQPQLYEFVRHDDPALFSDIQRRVAEGRWEPIGGMWVEADCNLSGAEALVRQLLLGISFFRQHFGPHAMSPVLWLPDVFGYAWNLPQLIKQAGLDYFFTIKLGWNQYNRLPYDSFWWQGLDTRVLTHFSTSPDWKLNTGEHLQRRRDARASPRYLEEFSAAGAAAYALDGLWLWRRWWWADPRDAGKRPGDGSLPRCAAGATNLRSRFLPASGNRGERSLANLEWRALPGTTPRRTPQSRTKRASRQSGSACMTRSFWLPLASVLDPRIATGCKLRQAWQLVSEPVHDIIPGSSIGPVCGIATAVCGRQAPGSNHA
jgi:alpha-mannosidase